MNHTFRNALCFLFTVMASWLMFAQKPLQIKGIAKEDKSLEYYEEQSLLWQAEIQKEKDNPNAWNNYYRAERAKLQLTNPDLWPGKKDEFYKLLDPILTDARAHIGDSYDYHLIRGMNLDVASSIEWFIKAYEIDPDRDDVYGWLMVHYMLNFDTEKLMELSGSMLKSNLYNNASLQWNYNALQSVVSNGVIVTNGDMDSMPKWVLQYGLDIRPDILVVNKWMLATDETYQKRLAAILKMKLPAIKESDFATVPEYVDHYTAAFLKSAPRPAYMSTGTDLQFFRAHDLEDHMYLVGNAIKYSSEDFNNTSVMKDNFENKYFMEYLLQNFQVHSQDEVVKTRMNLTYLPGLIHMRNYYDNSGDSSKVEWYARLIDKIAMDSGRKEEVLSWFN